jgi:uncharacterized membrane protein YqjE
MTATVDPRESHEHDLATVPTGELVRRLSTQVSELVKGELEVARAELTEKGKRAGVGVGLAGAGGIVALFGVAALLTAVIAGLSYAMPVWLAALIVGVVLLLIAGALAMVGRQQVKQATPPVPEGAVEGVQHDVEAVKKAVQR